MKKRSKKVEIRSRDCFQKCLIFDFVLVSFPSQSKVFSYAHKVRSVRKTLGTKEKASPRFVSAMAQASPFVLLVLLKCIGRCALVMIM